MARSPAGGATAVWSMSHCVPHQRFPGVTAAYNGRAWRDAWHLNPWSKGAYTCPRPGQYTDLFGIPELPEGPFHFAGEHTSSEYYGFLNGAVVAGERAAKEIALA